MKRALVIVAALALAALAGLGSFRLGLWNPSLDELKAAYAGPPSQFVMVEGVPFHIRDEGNANSTLPPLVLLNGHLGNLRMWDGWIPILAPEMRVIRLDYPPYGLSGPDPTGNYSTERSVMLLGALIDQMGLTKVNLGGTSNGALVATIYAIRNPARVGKLVVSTLPNGRPPKRTPAPELIEAARINRWLAPYQTETFFRAFLRDVFARPERATHALIKQYADINNRAGAKAWVDAYIQTQYTLWDTTDVDALLAQLTTPTLLQWGDGGKVLPPFVGDVVRAQLRNAPVTMARYPDAGHMPMLELPEQTARDALTFLTPLVP
ncbi:MAG: alpha/beta hydrolase [Rhodospirillaceae bacterium]|nr:alpha/beta hydrolase [Rhodospirillaceae bacterium]